MRAHEFFELAVGQGLDPLSFTKEAGPLWNMLKTEIPGTKPWLMGNAQTIAAHARPSTGGSLLKAPVARLSLGRVQAPGRSMGGAGARI